MDALLSFFTTNSPNLVLPLWIDLAAVIVGGIAGALYAVEYNLDIIGAVGLSFACGLGGGLIRDVTMQVGNVYMLSNPFAIPASVITAIVVFLFHGAFKRLNTIIEWVDILAVGFFVAAGCDKALTYKLFPFATILMGILTGVGGGLLRDVVLGKVPYIFVPSNFYAICAIGGAGTYWICADQLHLNKIISCLLSVTICVVTRRLSLHYNIATTSDVDWGPHVGNAARKISRHTPRRSKHDHKRKHGNPLHKENNTRDSSEQL